MRLDRLFITVALAVELVRETESIELYLQSVHNRLPSGGEVVLNVEGMV